jgi:hypothetical protein
MLFASLGSLTSYAVQPCWLALSLCCSSTLARSFFMLLLSLGSLISLAILLWWLAHLFCCSLTLARSKPLLFTFLGSLSCNAVPLVWLALVVCCSFLAGSLSPPAVLVRWLALAQCCSRLMALLNSLSTHTVHAFALGPCYSSPVARSQYMTFADHGSLNYLAVLFSWLALLLCSSPAMAPL